MGNASAALANIRVDPPDLVLTFIMMPGPYDIGLLRQHRANPDTRAIPVILLSSRAGKEFRVEGMEKGIDDNLIKS